MSKAIYESLKDKEQREILHEWLDYLLNHVRNVCPKRDNGCEDCERFWKIHKLLMIGFNYDPQFPTNTLKFKNMMKRSGNG